MKANRWIGFALGSVLLGACAQSNRGIQPRDGERVETALQAAGVQIYSCRASDDSPPRYEWRFVGPEADLYNGSGQRVGRHYGGPTWEAMDGSRVTGIVIGRAPARSEDSIPWLLLAARPVNPSGAFGRTTFIQRVDTVGGAVPREPCGSANVGSTARVPYAAQYVFFTR